MVDLSTTYLGLSLKNPVVPSASPLSHQLDNIKAMEDAGAAAVVMYSLFEEQFDLEADELSHLLSGGVSSVTDALQYFPDRLDYVRDPDGYVEHIRQAKESVDIPIIASMNGTSKGEWLDHSKKIEQAGADALELNIYFLTIDNMLFGLDVETVYLDVLSSVKKELNIPVAMKLSPFFTALPNFVDRLVDEGVDGVVLFNRFYQPDISVSQCAYVPELALSSPADVRLPLRWIAILYGQIDASLALTTGIHTGEDVLKAIMAGADIAQVCSVLLQKGIVYISELINSMTHQMEEEGITSIESIKGVLNLENYAEPAAFDRASYLRLASLTSVRL